VGFRVRDNHLSTCLHLLVSLEVGKLTFIAIFFYTDEDVDAIVPGIGTEHVYFFLLFISLIRCRREGELTKCQVSGRWDVEGCDLSNTRNVCRSAQARYQYSRQAVIRDDNRNELSVNIKPFS
jgi:hypothetical protein